VVLIASMAGKLGLAYVAPYVATKAGLIAATHSLTGDVSQSPHRVRAAE
jgi:short-subunit dehydrogenase